MSRFEAICEILIGLWAVCMLLVILCTGCSPIPLPLPGPLSEEAPTAVIFCGLRPGAMYAAHRDSVDVRTYVTATPSPIRGDTARLLLPAPGTFVLYYTGNLVD